MILLVLGVLLNGQAAALPGQAVSLEGLERDRPYIVEVRGEPSIYLVFR